MLGFLVNDWPLTPMQMGMLFQTLHGTAPGSYIQQFICTSSTPVDAERIANAFSIIAARHAALRLRFHWSQGNVRQSVAPSVTVPIEVRAWKGAADWEDFLDRDRARGFEVANAPLIRVTVVEEAPESSRMVMTSHHLLLDGRSRLIVMREFFDLLRGGEPGAPPAPFTDYLDWTSSQDHSASEPFWREYLRDMAAQSELPLPEPADQGSGCVPASNLPEATTAMLRSLAVQCGCTLNNVVQAAWGVVLARYSGAREAVFGATRACRHAMPGGSAQTMVGMLINSVPVRVRVDETAALGSLLAQLRAFQQNVRPHETTPLDEISRAANLRAGEPLFSCYLMFEDYGPLGSSDYPGWQCELREKDELLTLRVIAGRQISLSLQYDPLRYSEGAMSRVLTDVLGALSEMAQSSPDKAIDAIQPFAPSVAVSEARPLEFSNTLDALGYWTRTDPMRPVAISQDGVVTCTALDRHSNKVAHHLIDRGIPRGSIVAVSMERSAELIIALIGIWKAGCAYLPLDRRYPDERRRFILADSQAAAHFEALPDCRAYPETQPDAGDAPAPAYAMYTSGSTGKPKGVLVSQAALSHLCSSIADAYEITGGDRILHGSTPAFDISVEEIFPALWRGAAIVPAPDLAMSSAADFIDFVERHNCTILDLPTAFWHELTRSLKESGRDLPASVRLVVVGGERVLPEVFALWTTLPCAGRIRWLNSYGPTEATVTATLFEPAGAPTGKDLPIGKPIRGVNTYVLDSLLRPLPLEASGELYIGGAGVADGYLNAPELTSAKFVPDPFQPGRRMYRTGDRARLLASGDLQFLGRLDFQVKFRGFRIELGEVEAAAESCPGVAQAIAQVRNGKELVLFAARHGDGREGQSTDARLLRTCLSHKLVEWMVPTGIVMLDRLPVTTGGKIDRAALSLLPVDQEAAAEASGPRTPLEEKLTAIWQEVFDRGPIGAEDNFFALGGYSLLAMRLLVQIERVTGRALRFADLTSAPTIRKLARLIEGERDTYTPECLVVLREGGDLPPLFCMHGAGGVVHWYNDLAARIADRPVIGIQCVQDSSTGLPVTLESMSEGYMEAIRAVQPVGPYHFIGHSMGAMLAYQCAVICERRGDRVGLVASLDGWNRAADNPGLAEKVLRLVRYFLALSPAGKAEFVGEKFRWLREEKSRSDSRAAIGHQEDGSLDAIKAHNVTLARAYTAPPYRGEVTVFRASKRSATEVNDPALGWGSVAASVSVSEIPGSHYTLLSPPGVDVLAEKLNRLRY